MKPLYAVAIGNGYALSENPVDLMYAIIESSHSNNSYRLIAVHDAGHIHQECNGKRTAYWHTSRSIQGSATRHIIVVENNKIKLSNVVYRIDGKHLTLEQGL